MTEPEKGWLTCDTEKCRLFIGEVDNLSKEVANRFDDANQRIKKGDWYDWTPDRKTRFYQLWESFLLNHRQPWILGRPKRSEDCDSTLPGPCQKSNAETAGFKEQALAYDKKLSEITSEKSPVIIDKEKTQKPTIDVPSLNVSGGTKVAIALALAIGLVVAIRK